ncbi:MAG: DNA (cytosine-5-)-methyltransferase, partial [Spirochaetia bacterium]|nr:DNA (cytosine-5-)-methyltransferase [Spirochaetia bacterium]
VEGLINHDQGRTLEIIISHLKGLGYHVSYKLLDGQHFGLAQSRKRVYIVGTQIEEVPLTGFDITHATIRDIQEYGYPSINNKFTKALLKHYPIELLVGMQIKDKRGGENNVHSWDLEIKGKTSSRQRELLNTLLKERRKKHWAEEIGIDWMDGMPLTKEQIQTFFDDPNLQDLLDDLAEKGYIAYEHPKKLVGKIRISDTTKVKGYNIIAGKLSFDFSKILDPDGVAPTLVATDVSKLGIIDGKGIRRLTVREGLRMFGFPEDYDLSFLKYSEAFDLLGNTVCIPVIEAIAERIADYLA